jgi:tetratricopeptide (TPR) repeat protein
VAVEHEEIARTLVKLKREGDAVPEFESAIGAYDRAGKSGAAARTYLELSECLERLGQQTKMETALAECLRRSSAAMDYETYASGALRLAERLHRRRGASHARAHFEAAAEAFAHSAYSMIEKRQYREAIPHLEKAAACYERAGKPAEAAEIAEVTSMCQRRIPRRRPSTTRSASSSPTTASKSAD